MTYITCEARLIVHFTGYSYFWYVEEVIFCIIIFLATQEKAQSYRDEEVKKAFTDINLQHASMIGHSANNQMLTQVGDRGLIALCINIYTASIDNS